MTTGQAVATALLIGTWIGMLAFADILTQWLERRLVERNKALLRRPRCGHGRVVELCDECNSTNEGTQ